MKHYLLTVLISAFISFNTNAQSHVDFGLKGGLNITFFQVNEANFGPNTETEVGYYGGVFADFYVSESFSFQPELLYIGLGDFKFLNAPLYAKYEVAHNLDILLGPSLNYFFDFFTNKFKVRGDVSMAYNITDDLDIHIKYTLGFEEISPNGLFFGLGYRL